MDETSKTTFNTPCTPPQAEGATAEKKVREKNITLGIDDISNDMEKILPKKYLNKKNLDDNDKKVLAVILHACRTKSHSELGFYPIPNRTLRNIAKVGSNSLTAITNKLKMLGLINFEQGETRRKGKTSQATRYTILFDDKLVKKSNYFNDTDSQVNDTHSESNDTEQEVNDTEPKINDTEQEVNDTEPKINDTHSESNDTEQDCTKHFNDTQSVVNDTSVDNQGVTEKESKKSSIVNVNRYRDRNWYMDLNLNSNRNWNLNRNGNRNWNLNGNRNMYLDLNWDLNGDVNLEDSINNNNVGNTNNNMKELLEKIYDKLTSIDINTRVKSEANAKLIEEKDKIIIELQGKNQELNEFIKTKDEILDNLIGDYKELCGEYVKLIKRIGSYDNVKETSSKSNVETKTTTASSSTVDKIMTHQLGLAASNPIKNKAWEREQQKKLNTKTASKSNVGIVQESNSRERSYTLNKLRKEIVEPFKWMISNINDYGKLLQAEKDFNKAVNNLYENHDNVITKSEIEPFIDEVRTVIQQKEEEFTPKYDTNDSSSNSNVEDKATTTSKKEQCHFPTLRENQLNKLKSFMETFKERISKATYKETLEAIEADFQEDGINFFNLNKEITKEDIAPYSEEVSKAFQSKKDELSPNVDTNTVTKVTAQEPSKEDGKRFHTEEKTAPKTETSEEKEEATAEPSTDDGKNIEVPNADTLHSKEEQEKLDEEVDEAASSVLSEDNGKKCEEVELPNVEQIALREEEQKQLQELKDNKSIKPLLENFTNVRFTDNGAFDKILMEIRKAVTDGRYNQKVVQAFLDFSYTTYTFDCNVEDAMNPLEDTKDDTAETPSDDVMKRFPNTDKRFKEDEDQGEVIEESDDEVTDDDIKGVVVGVSYPEENDAIF